MDIYTIRRMRLQDQLKNFNNGERGCKSELATTLSISRQFLSTVLTGQKNMGGALARSIETSLGLPDGIMDTPMQSICLESQEQEELVRSVVDAISGMDAKHVKSHLELIKLMKTMDPRAVDMLFDIFKKNLGGV